MKIGQIVRAVPSLRRLRTLTIAGFVAGMTTACSAPEPLPPPPLAPAPPVLVVTHGDAGAVSVIDATTRSVVGTIQVGAKIGAATLTGTGDRLFAVVPDGIAVINIPERRLERVIRIPGAHTGVAVSGNRLFVVQTADNKGKVLAVDLATERIDAEQTIDDLAGQPDVTTDGRRLYVPHSFYSGRVTILDTGRLSVLKTLTFENGTTRVHLTPDERTLLVPNGSSAHGQVTLVDTAKRQTSADIVVEGQPTDAAITRDGQRAVVPLFGGEAIAVLDLTTRTVTRKIAVEGYPIHLALSPDDKTAYVLRNGTNRVYVVELETGATTVLELGSDAEDVIGPARIGRP